MRLNILRLTIPLIAFAIPGGAQSAGPYKILKTVKVGGAGGFDYVYADETNRRLYIPRGNPGARVTVFNLDTLEPAGEIANTNARGAVVSVKSNHGFSSSKPVAMWDAKTLTPIKTIPVEGNPDGILYDPFNDRVYIFSHVEPHATVINAADGAVLGTFNIGGMPEQAVSDLKGNIYVDVEDKGQVAVIDARTMKVTAHYDLEGKGNICAGLAMDQKNRILFATCRNPQNVVILSADTGKIIASMAIGSGTDGAVFNPATMEAFSSNGDGTLNVIKESSPTSFEVAQSLTTMRSAKTLTFDSKTQRILLIAAEYGPPATPPPAGGRAGRGPMLPDSFSILVVGK
jgi:DNA-binding beta-propeller fold protein YncE